MANKNSPYSRIFVYAITFLISLLVTYFIIDRNFLSAIDSTDTKEVPFVVEPGDSWKSISEELVAKGLLRRSLGFYGLVRLKKIPDNSLQVGEYRLSRSYSPKQILNAFINRDIIIHKVLIREGDTIYDVANTLASTGIVTYQEAIDALTNKSIMVDYGIVGETMEGSLFPLTYSFSKPTNAVDMVKTILTESGKQRTEGMYVKAAARGMTFPQILTLASIIQKEAANIEEMATISSVFYNRIEKGMPLQSDPTTVYHIAHFKGEITPKDLRTPSPWNTYLNTGLPPSPISNPGMDAILAALNPANTKYLYFVAKKDGTHYFSKNYVQHQKALSFYLKGEGEEPAPIPANDESASSKEQ